MLGQRRHRDAPGEDTRLDHDSIDLSPLMARARNTRLDAIPGLLGEIEAIRAVLWTRLQRPVSQPAEPAEEVSAGDPNLLNPKEASRLMGVTVRWLYRHHRDLPFARKLSRKTLRFSEPGLRRWLSARKG